MNDLYAESWRLYKHHTENFADDLEYYRTFCKNRDSLELFAGYGRITNHLAEAGVNIETIELSNEFSSLIKIQEHKKHVGDVTKVVLPKKFERIFAAYNSFCLLTTDSQLQSFFKNLSDMLSQNGLISLSYYHPDFWEEAVSSKFKYEEHIVSYEPTFDLSGRAEKKAVWKDVYVINSRKILHEYPVRIFESHEDLLPFLKPNNLRIVSVVENFNNPEISEPGWIDYLISF